MKIEIVVAVAKNGVIGDHGKLPWKIPSDLKRFRKLTMGHPVIMGRKTQESIGKILDGRQNIVLSRNASFQITGASTAGSLQEALAKVTVKGEVAFIIGGRDIFESALPFADRIHYTQIHQEFPGDVTFPSLDLGEYREVFREDHFDEPVPYSYLVLERRAVSV